MLFTGELFGKKSYKSCNSVGWEERNGEEKVQFVRQREMSLGLAMARESTFFNVNMWWTSIFFFFRSQFLSHYVPPITSTMHKESSFYNNVCINASKLKYFKQLFSFFLCFVNLGLFHYIFFITLFCLNKYLGSLIST